MKTDRNGVALDGGAERARWVAKYRASGLGLERFADRHGLSAGQLHYWVYGVRKRPVSEVPVPVFEEVVLPAGAAPPSSWIAEVGLPDGTTVRLGLGTEVAWVMSLVKSMRRLCSR